MYTADARSPWAVSRTRQAALIAVRTGEQSAIRRSWPNGSGTGAAEPVPGPAQFQADPAYRSNAMASRLRLVCRNRSWWKTTALSLGT
jgi:hypothetical protein